MIFYWGRQHISSHSLILSVTLQRVYVVEFIYKEIFCNNMWFGNTFCTCKHLTSIRWFFLLHIVSPLQCLIFPEAVFWFSSNISENWPNDFLAPGLFLVLVPAIPIGLLSVNCYGVENACFNDWFNICSLSQTPAIIYIILKLSKHLCL